MEILMTSSIELLVVQNMLQCLRAAVTNLTGYTLLT